MADSNKKDEYDIFISQSIYPEALSIFTSQLKSLEEIKDACYIVLDTNVLLAPYIIGKDDPGKDDLLEQCKITYKKLIEQKRLIVPGQVAREFAKIRIEKLAELYQQLSRKKQIQLIERGKYPLLNSLADYQEVERLLKEINGQIRAYQEAINKVLAHIQGWQINDPVRSLYSQLFNEDVIFDPQFDKEEIKNDLKRRQIHHIPPGYKDAGKEDSGVGDLLIWRTILKLGETQKRSVIFVSGDGKPDWFRQSENVALYLRYELVDEFRRQSGGQSFHIVKFSRFLELFEASDEIVKEVRLEEPLLTLPVGTDENTGLPMSSWAYEAIHQWLLARYPDFKVFRIRGREIDFLILERGQVKTAVKVIANFNWETVINRMSGFYSIPGSVFDDHYLTHLMVVNITPNEATGIYISDEIMRKMDLPANVSITNGYINEENKFIALSDIIRRPDLPTSLSLFDDRSFTL